MNCHLPPRDVCFVGAEKLLHRIQQDPENLSPEKDKGENMLKILTTQVVRFTEPYYISPQ